MASRGQKTHPRGQGKVEALPLGPHSPGGSLWPRVPAAPGESGLPIWPSGHQVALAELVWPRIHAYWAILKQGPWLAEL